MSQPSTPSIIKNEVAGAPQIATPISGKLPLVGGASSLAFSPPGLRRAGGVQGAKWPTKGSSVSSWRTLRHETIEWATRAMVCI